jgi:hypothetical protein
MGVRMSKYKNKDGIELNYQGNDSHKVLVREVVEEAIRILSSHNMFDKQSMGWAIDRGIHFLETNFNVGDNK